MSALDDLQHERQAQGLGGRWYGCHPALVSDIADPLGQGRVKVTLPWAPDAQGQQFDAWARLATMMAGKNRGSWFIPDVGDEVLVMFEGGLPARPIVIGALWNGQDEPPQQMDGAGRNLLKTIRSRNGVVVTLDDSDGQEAFSVETPGGQKLRLSDGPGTVRVEDSNGNSVVMEAAGITVTASATVTVNASRVVVSASLVQVDAGMSKFSGVVQADTVIANSVISASYTPGAGNIW